MNWTEHKEYRRFKVGDMVWNFLDQSICEITSIEHRTDRSGDIKSDLISLKEPLNIFGEEVSGHDSMDELHCEFLSEMKDELIEKLQNGISKIKSLTEN